MSGNMMTLKKRSTLQMQKMFHENVAHSCVIKSTCQGKAQLGNPRLNHHISTPTMTLFLGINLFLTRLGSKCRSPVTHNISIN